MASQLDPLARVDLALVQLLVQLVETLELDVLEVGVLLGAFHDGGVHVEVD